MIYIKPYLKLAVACLIANFVSGCVTYSTVLENNRKRLAKDNIHNHSVLVIPAKDYAYVPSCSNFNNKNIEMGGITEGFYYWGNGTDKTSATSAAISKCSKNNSNCIPFAHITTENTYCLADEMRMNSNRAQIAEASAREEQLEINKINARKNECFKMGFLDGTEALASCLLSLKNLEAQMIYHENRSREEAARVAEIKREQEIDRNLSLMQFGLGMAAGRQPRYSAPQSTGPVLAPPPPPLTFISPNGNRFTCSYVGASVSCR